LSVRGLGDATKPRWRKEREGGREERKEMDGLTTRPVLTQLQMPSGDSDRWSSGFTQTRLDEETAEEGRQRRASRGGEEEELVEREGAAGAGYYHHRWWL
jgi:hypothetical protein